MNIEERRTIITALELILFRVSKVVLE